VLTAGEHATELDRVRAWLSERDETHWRQYAAAWISG
jgi:hypothetical protein